MVEFLLEALEADKGSSEKASPCICCFRRLQLKIISMPNWHIWGRMFSTLWSYAGMAHSATLQNLIQ